MAHASLPPYLVFAKPAGALCNLECSYCYYLEKRGLYPPAQAPRMSDEVLERYVEQHIATSPTPTVVFCWHGGEPTVLGIDFYRRALELQAKYRRPGQAIVNGIQTNGTLIDEAWCRFLAQEKFLVGVSLDGPQELHDACRVGHGGGPTHERALAGYRMLRSHGVPCDILCVVNDRNVAYPREVYEHFKAIGADDIVFLPLVRKPPAQGSVDAQAFGEFLCTIFDEWIRKDMATIHILMFEEALRPARGLEHTLCVLRKTCGELPVLEHTGDFYSCDHFVDREHCLGNIRERSLAEVLQSPEQLRFGRAKWDTLARQCRQCSVLEYCHGGCPKDRTATTDRGEALNYLCPGLKRFFKHVKPQAQKLASFLKTGKPVGEFMQALRVQDEGARGAPGRNDPCPCGSGQKYKKCCGSRAEALRG